MARSRPSATRLQARAKPTIGPACNKPRASWRVTPNKFETRHSSVQYGKHDIHHGDSHQAAGGTRKARSGRASQFLLRLLRLQFEETLELADARGMAHFSQRLGFDLADALARDLELPAHFLERARVAIAQAKAQLEHLALALGEAGEHVTEFVLQQAEARDLGRILSGLILDKIAKAGVVAVAYRRLQGDGLLGHLEDSADPVHRHLHFLGQLIGRGL